MMKYLIIFACVFAAASAKWGYSYNIPGGYVHFSAGREASVVSAAPTVVFPEQFKTIGKQGVVADNRVSPPTSVLFALPNSIIPGKFNSMVKQVVDAANKAAEVLNELTRGLPAVLRSLDPAMKSDITKVDEIIGKVCDEIMFQAIPSARDFQYFTPESIMKTCEYIREVSADLVDLMTLPSIKTTSLK
jgi:hypothetical protein